MAVEEAIAPEVRLVSNKGQFMANEQWFAMSLEHRGMTYLELGLVAYDRPEALTESDWAILGVATRDEEAVAFIADNAARGNLGIDVNEVLEPTGLMNQLQRNAVDPSHMFAYSAGSMPRPPFEDNQFARLVFDIGTLFVGGGLAFKAGKYTLGGARFLARTAAGRAVANAIVKAAPVLDKIPAAFRNFSRRGFLTSSTITGGYFLYDEDRIDSDPDRTWAEIQALTLKSAAERMGFTYQASGTAAGGDGLYAAESEIILDPDGNPVTEEEMFAIVNGTLDGVDPEVVLEEPSPAPGTGGPQHISTAGGDGFQDVGSASSSVQNIPGIGSAINDPERWATQTGFRPDIDAKILGAEQVEAIADKRAANPALGVPDGYYRGPQDRNRLNQESDLLWERNTNRHMPDEMLDVRVPTSAVYQSSSIMDTIADWDVMKILEFQARAIEAGLINPEAGGVNPFFAGVIDPHTIQALTTAMTSANLNGYGQTYDEAMDNMIEARELAKELYGDEDQPPTWSPSRAYFKPDYASISQDAKGLFSRNLGRDPNGWEMDLLADQFRSDHRAEYDQDMAGDRGAFEARGRAQETGEVEIPGAQQDIDPQARMAETFDNTFSDELDAKSRWADVQSKSRNLFGSFDKLANS